MKNTNLLLTVILFSMIAIILVAGIALIIVLGNGSDGAATEQTTPNAVIVNTTPTSTTPWVPPFVTPAPSTTTVPSTTPPTPVTTTQPTPSVTTTVPPVTTTQKVPEVSTPATAPETDPGVTTPPTTTVTPPTTTKPDTPPPAPETISGIIEGEKVGSLGLYASYTAVTNPADETVTLKVTFYVESYALRIGARNDNYLLINGEKLGRLSNEAISLPDKSPLTRTVLYEYETVLQTDGSETTSLELEFFWHFQATYSGIHKEWLTVKVDLAF